MRFVLFSLVFVLGAFSYAQADGNFLYKQCQGFDSQGDTANRAGMFCIGYVSGFTDGTHMEFLSSGEKPGYCMPEGVSSLQAILVVKKYLEDNPQFLHQPESFLVFEALKEAFPCE